MTASVIPYPAIVVGLLAIFANGIAILVVPLKETPAIVRAVVRASANLVFD